MRIRPIPKERDDRTHRTQVPERVLPVVLVEVLDVQITKIAPHRVAGFGNPEAWMEFDQLVDELSQ